MNPVLLGHLIRWALELVIIWKFVFIETGPWTALVLTLMTIGIEFDYMTGKR